MIPKDNEQHVLEYNEGHPEARNRGESQQQITGVSGAKIPTSTPLPPLIISRSNRVTLSTVPVLACSRAIAVVA